MEGLLSYDLDPLNRAFSLRLIKGLVEGNFRDNRRLRPLKQALKSRIPISDKLLSLVLRYSITLITVELVSFGSNSARVTQR